MSIEIIYKKTSELIPYINNTRTHSDTQISQIASSIKEFGFTNPCLIDSDGGLIAGHGRVLGATQLNMDEVPCIVLKDLTETQKRAYIIADNKIALNAGWNEELLKSEMAELADLDFDLDLLGFDLDITETINIKDSEDVEEKPEIEITAELLEEHNYVVFYFDNSIDWLSVEQKLGLKKVSALFDQQSGLGRVVNGNKLLELL